MCASGGGRLMKASRAATPDRADEVPGLDRLERKPAWLAGWRGDRHDGPHVLGLAATVEPPHHDPTTSR